MDDEKGMFSDSLIRALFVHDLLKRSAYYHLQQ